MKLKFKLCTFILLIIVFTISLAGCSNVKSVGIGLLGGSLSKEPQLNENRLITDMEIPTREDGAQFQGWYSNLSFDEEIDGTKPIPENCDYIIAKWDKCYLFTLVYNRTAFYGVERDGIIGYYIPAGTYKIQMLEDSSAQTGNILVCSNSEYSYSDGYPIIKTISFNRGAIAESVTISNDQHIEVTTNSIFQFERVGINQKYLSRDFDYYLTDGSSVGLQLACAISGLLIVGAIAIFIWLIAACNGKNGTAILNYILEHEGASISELSSELGIKEKKVKFLVPQIVVNRLNRNVFYYDKKQKLVIKRVKVNNDKESLKQEEKPIEMKSNKEQLQELKEMLDDGLITQEDFEQKKKQILGL